MQNAAKEVTVALGAEDSQRIEAVPMSTFLTPLIIQNYARFMSDKFDLVYVTDEAVGLKNDIRRAVKCIAPSADIDDYLQKYAFTLGNLVWLPFSLKKPEPKPGIPFAWQIITIAHEAVHRLQHKAYGSAPFSWDYLSNEESRAQYEYEAYRTALELGPVLNGGVQYNIPALAEPLRAYGISDASLAYVIQQLTIANDIIQRGGVLGPTSVATIAWLRENVCV